MLSARRARRLALFVAAYLVGDDVVVRNWNVGGSVASVEFGFEFFFTGARIWIRPTRRIRRRRPVKKAAAEEEARHTRSEEGSLTSEAGGSPRRREAGPRGRALNSSGRERKQPGPEHCFCQCTKLPRLLRLHPPSSVCGVLIPMQFFNAYNLRT